MAIQSDHKALIFLGAVAVLGAGVRVVRASGNDTPAAQPALEHQMHAADSAAAAQRGSVSSAGRGRSGGAQARGQRDTTRRSRRDSSRRATKDTSHKSTPPAGLLDRPGYVGRRLDLDVASAAQIDSLPGVTPTMAKRIAANRVRLGPFLSLDGLRRVSGAGDKFLHAIDTLVTFSGTIVMPSAKDTIIQRATNTRVPRATPPVALRTAAPQRAPWLHEVADSCSPARARLASPRRAT